MKLFHLYFRLSLPLFIFSTLFSIFALFTGKTLPYMGDLAYISDRDGFNKLILMDAQRQFNYSIKRAFINDCCLTWSSDGRELAFVVDMSSDGSTDIFSVNFHSPIQRLTAAPGADLYPSYSPDSQHIAYTGYGYGNPEIYLMNADGSQSHVLTGEKHITNLNPYPVWSTDGESILFSDFGNLNSLLAVSTNCVEPCENAIQPVFNTNGLPLMTTTFIPLDQSRLFLAAFERTQQGGYAMYSLDTKSSLPPERLTINADLASPSVAVYDHWIAFASGSTNLQQRPDEANLYVLDANCIGTSKGCLPSIQKVAGQLRTEDNLSWSADGRWLAFVTISERKSQLNLLDTTCIFEHRDCTNNIHLLPIASMRYIRPVWRPNIH